jgi:flavin-binding protein dodecin
LGRQQRSALLFPTAVEAIMPGRVYKIIEVVGSSKVSIEDAVSSAIETCSESIDFLDWFEVKETRGAIAGGKVDHYQVVLRVGFRLDRGK